MAAWAKAEQRKKNREENRGSVRAIFGFLFWAAVVVFIFAERSEWETKLYTKVTQVLSGEMNSVGPAALKQNAMQHENDVNNIAK
jgi:hypothetical protein